MSDQRNRHRNIADPQAVAEQQRTLKRDQERLEADVRTVIRTEEGRRLVAHLLAHCRVSQSIWEPSAAIHKNAGKQEVGHYVLGLVVQADLKIGAQLLTEAYQRELTQGENHV